MRNELLIRRAMRLCRESVGMTLREAATAAGVSHSAVATWETRTVVPMARVRKLDHCVYKQGGALAEIVLALKRSQCLPADRQWGAHPSHGPLWGWFRGNQRTTAHVAWGPWRMEVAVPETPWGVAVTSPVGMPNPPLLVEFEKPARFDAIPGAPPDWLPVDVVDGLTLLRPESKPHRVLHRAALFLREFRPQALERALGQRVGVRPSFVRRLLAHTKRRPRDHPTSIPPGPASPILRLDGRLAANARRAQDLSERTVVDALAALPHVDDLRDGSGISAYKIKSIERNESSEVELAAALDMLYGLDGRLVCAPVPFTHSDDNEAVIGFFEFWQGPVWLALEPGPRPRGEVLLVWHGHSKRLMPEGPCTVAFRKSYPDFEPLVVTAEGWRVTPGIGRHPHAVDINAAWEFDERQMQRYEDVVMDALKRRVS